MRPLRPPARSIAWTTAAVVVGALFAAPLVIMVLGSLRWPALPPPRAAELLPGSPTLEAYRRAFAAAPLARGLLNSAAVAAIFVPVAVLVSSAAGFAVAQAAPRARRWLLGVVLLLFMVPAGALWISRFVLYDAAGVTGTWLPLLAPALLGGTPFGVLLYVFAFRRIPAEVMETAAMEGVRPLRVWWRIAMPLARGTTAAVAMLAFAATWGNLIDPLLTLSRESTFTAPLALRSLQELGPTNLSVVLAGSVVVTAPVVLVFLLAHRAFLRPERGLGWLR
jgi:multiple sugar transport system permease protein